MRPWFGLHLPNYTFPDTPPERIFDRSSSRSGPPRRRGFSLVTVMDHLYQIRGVGPETDPMLEGWSTLAALARETTRSRLGTLVTGVTYRNPALLAKTATTLDVDLRRSSDPRHRRGVERRRARRLRLRVPAGPRADGPPRRGADDHPRDVHRGAAELRRATTTGSTRRSTCRGRCSRGGPRILVGGGGEQRTLKIAAKHADMTHWFPLGLDVLRHKTEVLERHCAEIGRDPSTIERTMAAPVLVAANDAEGERALEPIPEERRPYVNVGPPEQMADALRPYLDAGFTGFTFNNSIYRTPEAIGRVGELLQLVGAGSAAVA